MTFYLVGIGLKFEDITLRGMEVIKQSDIVFLENYTSIYPDIDKLLEVRNDIKIVGRNFVETELEGFILKNRDRDIALLVIGDPLFATTHISLISFCKTNRINYEIIFAPSIVNYANKIGLFPYKFGKIVSIPFTYSKVPYEVLYNNLLANAHTLFLLDIDVENKKYMKLREALNTLLELEKKENKNIVREDSFIIVMSRVGWRDERIYCGKIVDFLIKNIDPKPPIAIIFPSRLNRIEEEFLRIFCENV